ncbi:efflux RND transporter periplasmic adaptor subunit [uncultured Paracoccus sp.]|uniref:efflux RND transporter periplasmic adaptor subunit n=1 Tax=uncultured Paracoccus sp. TaxID=189685 RepID=UPI002603675F|nr:efflux RND transporter periplasmic adaptor subunit [uncultured Paracoccus sp.]
MRKRPELRRSRHRRSAWPLAALSLSAALWLAGPAAALTLPWQREAPPPAEAPPRPVVTEIVADLPAAQRSVPGIVVAATEAVLGVQTPGTIIEQSVDIGDEVPAGEVLARLNPDDLQADVRAAEAALSAAEVQLSTAQATAERTRELNQRSVASTAQLEQAERALATAQAARQQAQSELARARDAAAFAELIAPFDGVISAVHLTAGTVVSAGQAVLTLASQDAREAVIDLTEAQLQELQPGDAFTVTPETDPSGSLPAVIDRIEPLADAATRTRRVHLALDPGRKLRIGALVRASRDYDTGVVLTVPPAALLRSGDDAGAVVWVVTRQGEQATVTRRDVNIGEEIGGRVRITAGLAPGEEVVVRGVNSLTDGQPVGRPVPP